MFGGGTQSSSPITVATWAQLAEQPFGFNEKTFRVNWCCFGSDRYVCLKDQAVGERGHQVGIVDMLDDFEVERRTTRKADGAMMYSEENVLALKGKLERQDAHFIQVFNLDSKDRLGDYTFDNEVVFWKWLHNRCLAIVTRTGAYHWFLRATPDEPETKPQLMFTRAGKLGDSDVQIINYTIDDEANPAQAQWCVLAGIHLSTTDRKTILGALQLYSVEKQQQQFLEGHAGCFGKLNLDDWSREPIRVFSFMERKEGVSKLYVMDIYSPRGEGLPAPFKATCELTYPADQANDFPIALHLSPRYGVIFAVTKAGYAMIFDAKTAQRIHMERVSSDGLFACIPCDRTGGVIGLNRKGTLLAVSVNEATIIQHAQTHLSEGLAIALSLAKRYGYAAADDVLVQAFRQAMQNHQYSTASRIAALSKGAHLRTPATLQAFKSAPNTDGQSSLVQYFNALLLLGGELTVAETTELMQPVVAQGRKEMVQQWLNQGKLACTEQIGDMLKPLDESLARRVYSRANCHNKVIQFYIERGHYNEILSYIKKKNYTADFSFLLRTMLNLDATKAVGFTQCLLENEPPLMDPNAAIDVFMQQNRVQEISQVLVEVLKVNRPDQGAIQTRLFEINLAVAPQAAEAIFQQGLFTHYDRVKIAALCEKAGLFRRALEHYTEMADIKRVMMRCGNQMSVDWLANFCQSLPPAKCIEILMDMIRHNRANLNAVVQVSIKFHDRLGDSNLIAMFDSVNSTEGLYGFLGAILAFSSDPQVHYKYIEAAARLQNWQEVERMIKESKSYDPVAVKEFLKSVDLADPRPLIYLCDIHNFVGELAEYLYGRGLNDYIEVYVSKVNSQAAAMVIGRLLDLGCPESFVLLLLNSVKGACPLEPLIPDMEGRGRLRLIQPWMEARLEEGISETVLHNALAKVYIDTNHDPEQFLATNQHYDPREIGQYCEERDPHLAVTAFMRGHCDQELIDLTNKNGLYRLQAQYLVRRKNPEVWATALGRVEHRRALVDQVVAAALPEAQSVEEISVAVKAFVSADIPHELLELLERVVLQKSVQLDKLATDITKAASLQNLLLLTAMSAEPSRVKDYINRLDSFDGAEVARVAVQEFQLYEEALLIYTRFNMHAEALQVLLDKIQNFAAAEAYVEKIKDAALWKTLAEAELLKAETAERLEASNWIIKCMLHYAQASKCTETSRIIAMAKQSGRYSDLADFLRHMRGQRPGAMLGEIDSELAYCLAKTRQWAVLESFLMGPNTTNTQLIGDRLFEEGDMRAKEGDTNEAEIDFKAAKVFYAKVPNHAKLTLCHLRLSDHSSALESARRANSAKCWTEVALAAVRVEQWKIAQNAGLHVLNFADHLERVIAAYESSGHYQELTEFMESAVSTGKGTIGLYTEMGVIYAKYQPTKLTDFLRSAPVVSAGRLNVPRLIRICEAQKLWKACVLLFMSYNEYDQAAHTAISHSAVAWEHEQFIQIMLKATNVDLAYSAVVMYLEEQPTLLNSFMTSIAAKLDYGRLISTVKRHELYLGAPSTAQSPLALIQPWLEERQPSANESTAIVNETLHELYINQCDIESLRKSISHYDNFDQAVLAEKLENNDLLEMKQLALKLYERNGRYNHAIELAKKFKQFPEAVTIALKSQDQGTAERLLEFFVKDLQNSQLFMVCLKVCQDLIRPDFALELAWVAGLTDEVMPFIIHTLRAFSQRLDSMEKQLAQQKEQQHDSKKAADSLVTGFMGVSGLAMLPPSPFGASNI